MTLFFVTVIIKNEKKILSLLSLSWGWYDSFLICLKTVCSKYSLLHFKSRVWGSQIIEFYFKSQLGFKMWWKESFHQTKRWRRKCSAFVNGARGRVTMMRILPETTMEIRRKQFLWRSRNIYMDRILDFLNLLSISQTATAKQQQQASNNHCFKTEID